MSDVKNTTDRWTDLVRRVLLKVRGHSGSVTIHFKAGEPEKLEITTFEKA